MKEQELNNRNPHIIAVSGCWQLLALAFQAQRSDFLLVFHPPQAPSVLRYLFLAAPLSHIPLSLYSGLLTFSSTCLSLGLENRSAHSRTRPTRLTSLAMWLIYFLMRLCWCLSFSHSLVFFSSACCYSPSSIPFVCCGTSIPCLCLLVGQCQGVRRGPQLGMGIMGGVLVAVTA